MAGFEPATSCSQSRRDSRATLHPDMLRTFAERGGFEPPVPVTQYDSLANCWFQPLTHLSVGFVFLKTNLFRLPSLLAFLCSEMDCKDTKTFYSAKKYFTFFSFLFLLIMRLLMICTENILLNSAFITPFLCRYCKKTASKQNFYIIPRAFNSRYLLMVFIDNSSGFDFIACIPCFNSSCCISVFSINCLRAIV